MHVAELWRYPVKSMAGEWLPATELTLEGIPGDRIGGVDGLAERDWGGRMVRVGEAVARLRDLRGRCVMTTFDPDTVAQDVEVLKRINREFTGRFALNGWVSEPGRVAVGDRVELLETGYPVAAGPPAGGRYDD